MTSDYRLSVTDDTYHFFYAGSSSPGSSSWTDSSSGDTFFDGGFYFDSYFGGTSACRPLLFSSHTIFSFGSFDGSAYCSDIVPYDSGQPIFERVNLESDNQTFQRSTSPSAPPVVITPDTSDYVEVPDLITDPSGFVTALLTNLGIFLYNLVLPDSDFLSEKFLELQTSLTDSFPWFYQLKTAYEDSLAALPTSVSCGTLEASLPTLSLYGSAPMLVLNCSYIDPYMTTLRFWMGNFIVLGALIYAFKRSASLIG